MKTTNTKLTSKKSALPSIREEASRVSYTHKPLNMDVDEWQRLLRKQFGEKQEFELCNVGNHPLFSNFRLTNPASGKTYRLAIRGDQPGDNFCSCPDFSINTLGTCKHLELALARLKKQDGAAEQFAAGHDSPFSEVYLSYGIKRELRFRPGSEAPRGFIALARRYFDLDGVLKEKQLPKIATFLKGLSR
ncbi:MAG TPA: hypothetical protein DER40_14775 [Geobacter sp.]|nr:hypothetical protein [Geobacter sp.]HCE68716.1 hypothetical protein [Geobacter sp.]